MSSQVEQELSDLYGYCNDIVELCKKFNLPVDSEIRILMTHIFAYKGVLYCNNPVLIADEKIPLFKNINKAKNDGILFNNESSRQEYLKIYNEYEIELKEMIDNKNFFKKYWF
jgi:hypothetical protein